MLNSSEEFNDKLELKQPYRLGEIITVAVSFFAKEDYLEKIMEKTVFRQRTVKFVNSDYFYLYIKKGEFDNFNVDTKCYLEEGPKVTDNDEEIYPDFVLKKGLELFCSDELFEDVISSVLLQKNQPCMNEYLASLKYYLEYDCFLDLKTHEIKC